MKFRVNYNDIWGNDRDGYDFNGTFSARIVEAKNEKQAVKLAYTGNDRTLKADYEDADGITFTISERQPGRRRVPKFYVERIEE